MGDETRAARACRPCVGVHGRGSRQQAGKRRAPRRSCGCGALLHMADRVPQGVLPTCGRLRRWAAGWGRYGVWPAAVSEGGGIQSGAMSSKEV